MKTMFNFNDLTKIEKMVHKNICSELSKYTVTNSRDKLMIYFGQQYEYSLDKIKEDNFTLISFDIKGYFDNFDYKIVIDILKKSNKHIYKKQKVRDHLYKLKRKYKIDNFGAGLPIGNIVGEIWGAKIFSKIQKIPGVYKVFRFVDDYRVFCVKKNDDVVIKKIHEIIKEENLEFSMLKTGHNKYLGYEFNRAKNKDGKESKKIIFKISKKKLYTKILPTIHAIYELKTTIKVRKKILSFYISAPNLKLKNGIVIKSGLKRAYPLSDDFDEICKYAQKITKWNIKNFIEKTPFEHHDIYNILDKLKIEDTEIIKRAKNDPRIGRVFTLSKYISQIRKDYKQNHWEKILKNKIHNH